MTIERDLAPGEWSVLALLAEQPSHGWALARQMTRTGDIGAVWSLGRPLVYRALELLEQRSLIEAVGHEPGLRGPNRTIFRATPLGREELERTSRTWSTGSVSQRSSSSRPCGVARKIVRLGPRSPGSWPTASTRPRCSSSSSAR